MSTATWGWGVSDQVELAGDGQRGEAARGVVLERPAAPAAPLGPVLDHGDSAWPVPPLPDAEQHSRTEIDLVIVTGLSGGGRSTVARALENVGFYVVDNLPPALMIEMAELAHKAGGTA